MKPNDFNWENVEMWARLITLKPIQSKAYRAMRNSLNRLYWNIYIFLSFWANLATSARVSNFVVFIKNIHYPQCATHWINRVTSLHFPTGWNRCIDRWVFQPEVLTLKVHKYCFDLNQNVVVIFLEKRAVLTKKEKRRKAIAVLNNILESACCFEAKIYLFKCNCAVRLLTIVSDWSFFCTRVT